MVFIRVLSLSITEMMLSNLLQVDFELLTQVAVVYESGFWLIGAYVFMYKELQLTMHIQVLPLL